MITMNIEIINPYVLKIIVAARKEDSIKAISNRAGISYGWTYKWIKNLAKLGVFKLTRMKTFLNEDSSFYTKTLHYIKETLSKDIQFNYEVVSLLGIDYCFTKVDAVFIWTRGGYNIARYKDFYPIFIKVKKKDKRLFEEYCNRLNLAINKKKGVFYRPIFSDNFKASDCEGIPVDSLTETISFMKENRYNFEPALEMVEERYKRGIKIKYKEFVTNV